MKKIIYFIFVIILFFASSITYAKTIRILMETVPDTSIS